MAPGHPYLIFFPIVLFFHIIRLPVSHSWMLSFDMITATGSVAFPPRRLIFSSAFLFQFPIAFRLISFRLYQFQTEVSPTSFFED
jgi:hypothetical protein